MGKFVGVLLVAAMSNLAVAESVIVKNRGKVNLAPFRCERIAGSNLIKRICYDEREQYLLLNVAGTYLDYCGVRYATVSELESADSLGRYFNAHIDGYFDCSVNRVPKY
jgi:hypothetical protein